jgi:MFS family permease
MGAQAAGGSLTARQIWWMAGLLAAVNVMALLDRLILALLIPGIKASLLISDTQISLIHGAAFGLCYGVAGLAFGRLVDRLNRRNLLIIGLVGWSLATVACGLAQSFPQLIAARVAVGVFQALVGPAGLSMVADAAPLHLRGRVTAVVVSGGTFGSALASLAGGALLQAFAARPALISPFGGALAPWQSTLAVAGAAGLLLAPLLATMRDPGRQVTAGGASFSAWGYLARHRAAFVPLLAGIACFIIVGYAQASWFAVILLRGLRMPPAAAGLAMGLITVGGAVVSAVVGGWLSDRFARADPHGGRIRLLQMLLPVVALASIGFMAKAPALVITAFAMTATLSTITATLAATILPELTPSEGRGRVMAIYQFIAVIGGMGLAPTVVALITDRVLHDESRVAQSVALVSVPGLALAVLLIGAALPHARKVRAQRMADATAPAGQTPPRPDPGPVPLPAQG